MNTQLPGFRRTVGPVVSVLITVAVRVLPPTSRDRYDAEFRAELVELAPAPRAGQALSLLLGAPSLRHALEETVMAPTDPTTVAAHNNWRCRIGRHRYFQIQDNNPENRQAAHLECTRCRRVKEIITEDRASGGWIGKRPFPG